MRRRARRVARIAARPAAGALALAALAGHGGNAGRQRPGRGCLDPGPALPRGQHGQARPGRAEQEQQRELAPRPAAGRTRGTARGHLRSFRRLADADRFALVAASIGRPRPRPRDGLRRG